jgi:hypothetical protein
VAIVVVGLLWGGILSNPIHAVSQDDLMTLNPHNQTFSDDAIFNLTFNETIDNTSSCDCSTSLDDYYIDFNYTEIYEVKYNLHTSQILYNIVRCFQIQFSILAIHLMILNLTK